MNQNPQASTPEFQPIDVSEHNPYKPILSPYSVPFSTTPTDHNWQFRKMRPTCFATNKNAPGGPSPFWRKKLELTPAA